MIEYKRNHLTHPFHFRDVVIKNAISTKCHCSHTLELLRTRQCTYTLHPVYIWVLFPPPQNLSRFWVCLSTGVRTVSLWHFFSFGDYFLWRDDEERICGQSRRSSSLYQKRETSLVPAQERLALGQSQRWNPISTMVQISTNTRLITKYTFPWAWEWVNEWAQRSARAKRALRSVASEWAVRANVGANSPILYASIS